MVDADGDTGGSEDQETDAVEDQDELEGLLDEDDADGSEDSDSGGDESGDDAEPVTMEAIQALMESTIDPRINGLMNKQKRRKDGDGRQRGSRDDSRSRADGPSASELREARSAYREFVGDRIRFLAPEEREYANGLAAGMLRDRLSDGVDAEDAGAEVAAEVADRVTSMRRLYEKRVVASLRKKGLLPEKDGQPVRSKQSRPGDASGYAAGKARAEKMFAGRLPATE